MFNTTGEFKITHTFHPQFDHKFNLISINHCWGEQRVSYVNNSGEIASIPISWTDIEPVDPFVKASCGRSIFHVDELIELRQLINSIKGRFSEDEV